VIPGVHWKLLKSGFDVIQRIPTAKGSSPNLLLSLAEIDRNLSIALAIAVNQPQAWYLAVLGKAFARHHCAA